MPALNRRQFLAATAAGALAPALPFFGARAQAGKPTALNAIRRTIEVNGRAATVFGLLQPDGTRGLVTDAGRQFHVVLTNETPEATLIHWHGLTPPADQDGVPGLSQPALPSGARYTYNFPLVRPGTNWMHSHVGLQEQLLLAAPLIIRDPKEAGRDEQEVVVLLHDFTFRDPTEVFADLRGGPGHRRATPATANGAIGHGASSSPATMDHAAMSHGVLTTSPGVDHPMTVAPMDLNDVEFDAYLANDRTLADPGIVPVERGGVVRLRIINGAAATNFFVDLGILEGEVIAVDGMPVLPRRGRRFELAIAQRIDIRLRLPARRDAWAVFALREGDTMRTGLILAVPGARVAKMADRAERPAGIVGLDLETKLWAAVPLAKKTANRTHALDLTGSMKEYVWSLNGRAFGDHVPLLVRYGERVEITLRNRTEMSHPMHLHGHHFQIVAIDGLRFDGAVRDTVLVPANRSVTIAFDANNPGHWAIHCHNLYHMAAGMMTSVKYEA
jgi:FtsP/CotA-like multicopper oxidase with cupredoxin domain